MKRKDKLFGAFFGASIPLVLTICIFMIAQVEPAWGPILLLLGIFKISFAIIYYKGEKIQAWLNEEVK